MVVQDCPVFVWRNDARGRGNEEAWDVRKGLHVGVPFPLWAMRSLSFFSYPTPTSSHGVVLSENHRATTFLIGLIGPFYDWLVVRLFFPSNHYTCIDFVFLYLQSVSSSTSAHDAEAFSLMESLRGIEYVEGDHTFIWLNVDSPSHRHELTDSWFNEGEAAVLARVTDDITRVTSDANVLLITGYAHQVGHISSFICFF